MSERVDKLVALATSIVERATKSGAGVAEALVREGQELSAKVRMGEPELVEEASPRGVGLRVIIDGKAAVTYSSDTTESGLDSLVRDAIELAELAQPDEFNAPPDSSLLATSLPEMELFEASAADLDAATAIHLATEGEKVALAYDPRIVNSEGASYSREFGGIALVTSGGFSGGYESSFFSMVVNPIAREGDDKMQNGYHWDAKRFRADLESPESIGAEAARRTLDKLGAKKVETCEAPVVFDPDAGRALLQALLGCLSGHAIYRRTSYLLDREGDQIASDLVTLVDDPLLPRGPGSRPFDGEGLPSRKNIVVEQGVLRTYLLDTYSARKLGKESTGNASRGLGSSPSVSPTNFQMLPGDRSPQDILGEVDAGLYVTSMMGFGFNPVTGDFSRGAEGFWIEKGKKVRPVGEITISLGFDDLFKSIDAVGSDLLVKSRVACPTFRVKKMTIAGN